MKPATAPSVKPVGLIAWPTSPRKPFPDVTFLNAAYFAGFKAPGGKTWLLTPGQWHTGIDLNGPGGGDSDLGQPIFSVADGVVTFADQAPGKSWGNVITIWHGTFGTRYGHEQRVLVKEGQRVTAGQQIGTMGKGYANKFLAHLHFDVFVKPLPSPGFWPGGNLALVKEYFVDPWAWLRANKAQDLGDA